MASVRIEHTLSSVKIRVGIMSCEERETLAQIYIDATENHRNVSDSFQDISSPEWLLASEKTRQACETTLAALKLHIREHGCGTLSPRGYVRSNVT